MYEVSDEALMKWINFEFLRPKWPELASLGGFAEGYAHTDQIGSISKLRSFCEQAVEWTQGDTKGDLYEYLLSKRTTAGINGQVRTPRHIIRLMVDLVLHGSQQEAITWTVGDPAAGTGGFLVGFLEALREHYTSEEGKMVVQANGKDEVTYTDDQITPAQWKHIQGGMFHGFDFDVTMLCIAAMNLMLHGVDTPDIHYQDTLSNTFPEKFPGMAVDAFDLIMANPPFKGSLDYSDVHSSTFDALTEAIGAIHREIAAQASRAVNISLTVRNWLIGCYIAEFELHGSDRAAYGDKLLKRLASRLADVGIPTCKKRRLYAYLRFYHVYPDMVRSLSAPLQRVTQRVTAVRIAAKEKLSRMSFSASGFALRMTKTPNRNKHAAKRRNYNLVTVPFAAIPAGEPPGIAQWAHRAVWTDRMLTTLLEDKVRGGKWHALIDKVAADPWSG